MRLIDRWRSDPNGCRVLPDKPKKAKTKSKNKTKSISESPKREK